MKLTDYSAVNTLKDNNIFILDGPDGTKKINVSDLRWAIFEGVPEMHRNIYRGKNLGTTFKTTQKNAIQSGTFSDIYIGDYWTINGVTWRVADIDYFYGRSTLDPASDYNNDTTAGVNKHHIIVVPDSVLYKTNYNSNWNSNNYVGYVNSDVYKTGLTQAKSTVASAFDNTLLNVKESLSSRINESSNLCDQIQTVMHSVDNMSQLMVFGSGLFTRTSIESKTISYETPVAMSQFKLFNLNPSFICAKAAGNPVVRDDWMLRDQLPAYSAILVDRYGQLSWANWSNVTGVRPFAVIG